MTIPLVLFVVTGAGFGAIAGLVVVMAASEDLERRAYSRGRAWWLASGLGAVTLAYFVLVSVAVGIAEFGAR